MKKKLLVFAWPVGAVLFVIYRVGDQHIVKFPDIIAYPWMVISILCMLVGCFYNGYCASKGLNPYSLKTDSKPIQKD